MPWRSSMGCRSVSPVQGRRGLAVGATMLLVPIWLVASATPAAAHPFLVRTEPAAGARLDVSPRLISLQFSEALGAGRPEVSLVRKGESASERVLMASASGGRVLRGDVSLDPGVYRVEWRVVADDGHLSGGDFAFSVGEVRSALREATTVTAPASPFRAAVAWLFSAGVALALGAAATAVVVDRDRTRRYRPMRAGLAFALGGATSALLMSATGTAGPAGTDRQVALLGAVSALLALAMLLRRRARATSVLVVVAATAWSARGQVGVARGALGVAVDMVHLVAAAVWIGALALLIADLWRARRDGSDQELRIRRYATVAIAPVVVLAAAGLLSAVLMVPALEDLWSTAYGRLVSAKTALFSVAVALAWWGRRTVRTGRTALLSRLTGVEVGVLLVVMVTAAVLGTVSPPPPRVTTASLLGPPPFTGAVTRDAGLAGILTVAVAAGDGRLQVEVLPPGGPVPGSKVEVAAASTATGRVRVELDGCGDGCLSGAWDPPAGTYTVRVMASAPTWRGGGFTARITWPPVPEDPVLLERVLATMRATNVVEVTETVSSGPDSVVVPSRFSRPGPEAVAEAPYGSGTAEDIRPLAGEGALELYLPGDRIWVKMWLDDSGRIDREQIVSVGHLIQRQYRYPSG